MEFFTAVSHELKTPIAIIKGQLEGMIYQVGEYKDRDTYLRRCLKTTNDMEALVKEICRRLGWAAAISTWRRTDLDISQMLRKVCQQFRGRMEDKQMELRMDIQPEYHYQGDRRLMRSVHQCDRKCRGIFASGGCDYCHTKGRGVFRGEYRRPHCRGRFGAYLHSLLPGGPNPGTEQRRQWPGAVYH